MWTDRTIGAIDMKKIKTRATVNEEGVLTLRVPVDIEPGEYEVAVLVEDQPSDDGSETWPLKLVPLRLDAWPPDSTFSREEIYDDDGR